MFGLQQQQPSFIPAQVVPFPTSPLVQEAYSGELSTLRQQASWLSHLVDTMPAGVIVLDGKGMVAKANRLAIEMLGEPLEGEKWLAIIRRSFRLREDDGHEVSLRDGRRIKLEISSLAPEAGQLILMTDLTETRQLQQRVAHLQRLSALGKMVASLAHQIRTPLSAAMLYAANLGSNTLSTTVRQNFQNKLLERLKDLESQVNDMLLFAKSGGEQVVKPVSLQQLLTEVKTGAEAMCSAQQAELTVELPEPDVEILGNKSSLASAIQNLIHNSLQMIPVGAQLHLTARRDAHSDGQVYISVADNGPGIDEAIRERIFEPFFTTRTQGTGLGLAVVQAVASSHKGRAQVMRPERGAEIRIYLPIYATHRAMPEQTVDTTAGLSVGGHHV